MYITPMELCRQDSDPSWMVKCVISFYFSDLLIGASAVTPVMDVVINFT